MRRKGLAPLVFIAALTVASAVYTVVSGNSPLLGLDLQGGASVVLQPTSDVEGDTLDQAIDIIRQRVDGLGVAEPDITRQGDTVVVQLPGVDNQQRALDLVGQTAELRFRPVLQVLPPVGDELAPPTTIAEGEATTTTAGGGGGPSTTVTATTGTDEQGLVPPPLAPGENAGGPPPTTEAPGTTLPPDLSIPPDLSLPPDLSIPPELAAPAELPDNLNDEGITPRAADRYGQEVVLPERDDDGAIIARYHLGPGALRGDTLEGADAVLDQSGTVWSVSPTFKGGADGIDQFNEIALTCNTGAPECPTTQLAIVLDGTVISAPSINEAEFQRDQIQITGDFDEGEAKDLALVLRFGALPVELETQQVQTVSATLGEDSLRAGIISGIVGLAIVAVFMIAYYRLLGVVAVLSLALSATLLWAMVSWLGESQGLALTLAGITGIIVSIGVSLDSNVVYFEHIKEDIRAGRTFRSTLDRSFEAAFSTIVKADVASLIGAGVLYWLTVGPVRGFALYLGLATLLDLVASWFFMRPAVVLLGRSRRLRNSPRAFGMPDLEPATAEATT